MEKRTITKSEAEAAPQLDIRIPDFDGASHPFSLGQNPEIYTRVGLKKVTTKGSRRTDWFLEHLCTMHDIIGSAVPFYFQTSDGKLRSLDAGCLGYLFNRTKPYIAVNLGPDGFISSVDPTDDGLKQVRHMIPILRQKMEASSA